MGGHNQHPPFRLFGLSTDMPLKPVETRAEPSSALLSQIPLASCRAFGLRSRWSLLFRYSRGSGLQTGAWGQPELSCCAGTGSS